MILLGMFALWASPFHIGWPWWAWVVVFFGEWVNALLRYAGRTSEMKKEALKLQNILEGRK